MTIPAQCTVSRTGNEHAFRGTRRHRPERFKAIKRASELKSAPHEARVTWRVEEVARRVREAAAEAGFDADVAERIWRAMMEECIAYERRALGERVTNRQEESQ